MRSLYKRPAFMHRRWQREDLLRLPLIRHLPVKAVASKKTFSQRGMMFMGRDEIRAAQDGRQELFTLSINALF